MPSREVSLLLVDDDPSSIQSMSRILAQYPNKRFATNGEDALRLAREAPPDLIVVDAVMPGMSGLDLCAALKADAQLTDVPVVIATGKVDARLRDDARKHGVVEVLAKPLVPSQLIAQVREQLQARWLLEAAVPGELADPDSRPARTRPLFLIVDDDVASIHILRHMLSGMGDFHFASSGVEALELARRLAPDLILLDVHMPDLDGFEVCTRLKAEPAFVDLPIVFVTRFSDPQNEKRALELGAADFVAKPYTRAVLQARVRNVLGVNRRIAANRASAEAHWKRIGDARVADIVAGASDAIVSADPAGNVVLINRAACRMLGVEHAAAIGTPIAVLLGVTGPLAALWSERPRRDVIQRPGGEPFPVEVSITVVGGGETALTTATLRDIGDRERLEAESRLRIRAEAAQQATALMMAYIAHEIGNPLSGVLGFAEIMASDADHPLGPEQAHRLDLIVASGKVLQSLMRDVIDLGRSATDRLTVALGPTDAARCALDAVASVSALAATCGVTVSAGAVPPVPARADPGRLHQCLVNLLSNAIKYSSRGGRVRVAVSSTDEGVLLAVSDVGIGMDETQLHHLFEPFNRLGREGAAAYGAGLGLVVTRQLVLAMNGELRVESALGLGSVFTIVLPADRGSPAGAEPAPPGPSGSSP
jgi:CheY-like chemotaxis protein/nitrogen-specific signal transduction histidine kinase